MFRLSTSQSATLSNFCNDIAKGLFLGVVINQIVATGPIVAKLMVLSFGIIIGGTALYLALVFSK